MFELFHECGSRGYLNREMNRQSNARSILLSLQSSNFSNISMMINARTQAVNARNRDKTRARAFTTRAVVKSELLNIYFSNFSNI